MLHLRKNNPKLSYKIARSKLSPVDPYCVKDINILERVQRRVAKLSSSIRKVSYEERLAFTRLPTLHRRRQRGDLILLTFRTFRDLSNINLFELNKTVQRHAHSQKTLKSQFRTLPRQHFWSNRVINMWNDLPEEAVNAPSMNIFKKLLDVFFDQQS